MITELQVLNKLKDVIVNQLGDHYNEDEEYHDLLEAITADNVEIAFPKLDSMKKNTMLYIQPDYEEITDLSMGTDFASMNATIYIMCKGGTNETLIKKVFGFYTAFYSLIRSNQTLDDFVDFAKINSMDYYPAVTASQTMTAIEVTLNLQWAKCF